MLHVTCVYEVLLRTDCNLLRSYHNFCNSYSKAEKSSDKKVLKINYNVLMHVYNK